nr:MAG TPA: hypothetical protein [Caudoviricetes sp.]
MTQGIIDLLQTIAIISLATAVLNLGKAVRFLCEANKRR